MPQASAFGQPPDATAMRTMAEQALSTLHKMIPDSKDNPVSITGAEPYLFVNCWCMHPSFFTRIWFGWFTGTSAWALRGFYEGICGLRREYGGLRVQPCIPGAWKELTLTRTFRSCRYHIHIFNTGSGKPEVTVDGNRLADTLLPVLNDGQIHEVVVRT